MGSIKFKITSNKNEGLIISPSELLDTFLSGISLVKRDGTSISENQQLTIIQGAQSLIEKILGIKIKKQVIEEDRNYESGDLRDWLYLRTSFPVNVGLGIQGWAGATRQIEYPRDWISHKKSTVQNQRYRQISLIPNGSGSSGIISTNYSGFLPISFTRYSMVPNYWKIKYITGFSPENVDSLILQAVGKISAIDLLGIASNSIIGPGLTGTSLSIDGLSQSIQTAKSSSSGAFAPQITQYTQDLEQIIKILKSYYKGLLMTSA